MKISKKDLLKNFPVEKQLAWTIQEFAAIHGYSEDYISEQIESGEIELFAPPGRTNIKITPEARDNWIKRYTTRKGFGGCVSPSISSNLKAERVLRKEVSN